ncbi:MAG TPA: carboxypeptidase regulatory-like domain-containing protein [Bryobacteraceae bacterium]|nr:carboxypeptidase regulatory-like domain-containing protein [Bryobacteraceae bacterium]
MTQKLLQFVLVLSFLLPMAMGQAQDPNAPKGPAPGSIRGTVTDAGSGAPMPEAEVYVNNTTPQMSTVTDTQGHYQLRGLEARRYRVTANAPSANGRNGFGPSQTRQVELLPGQDLDGFDFHIVLPGQISGRVVDQNKEPVPGIAVYLVVREYVAGALRAVFTNLAITDDQGEYHLGRVAAGRSYMVMAQRLTRRLDAVSDAPADPRLRRPAVVPTFYPNSRSMDGAEMLVLRSGEQREGIDIRLVRSPAYCLDGIVEGGSGPANLRFEIGDTQPANGTSGNGGFYSSLPGGTPGPDGKVRICDLHPGDYAFGVQEFAKESLGSAPYYGSVPVTIADRDLQNVRVSARPRVPLAGEVVWDGPAPDTPLDTKLAVELQAITRTERGNFESAVPGQFAIEGGLLIDEFGLRFSRVPAGLYIKDVTYGGHSILYGSLKLGTAVGDAALRIVVARDGGTASARVTDKDGNAVPECAIVLLPASASNEATLAAALTTGRTDLRGTWTSAPLAPGKYYVLATNDAIDKSQETIAKLWRARTGAQELEITANGSAAVTLVPRGLE